MDSEAVNNGGFNQSLRAQLLLLHAVNKLCVPNGLLRGVKARLLAQLAAGEFISPKLLEKSEADLEELFSVAFQKELSAAIGPEKDFWSCGTHSSFQEDFSILAQLGSGCSGTVYKVARKIDGRLYAVKCIKIKDTKTKKDIKRILREVQLLSLISHPHVVRYFNAWYEFLKDVTTPEKKPKVGQRSSDDENKASPSGGTTSVSAWDDPGSGTPSWEIKDEEVGRKLYIQMQFCPKVLSDCLKDPELSQTIAPTAIFKQIVMGLEYVHDLGIVHRDIKASNILLDENFTAKIGDFGSSKQVLSTSSAEEGDRWEMDVMRLGDLALELFQAGGRQLTSATRDIIKLLKAANPPSCTKILTDQTFRLLIDEDGEASVPRVLFKDQG